MEVLQSSHDQVRSLGAEVTQVGTPPALYSFMYNFSYRDFVSSPSSMDNRESRDIPVLQLLRRSTLSLHKAHVTG